MSQESLVNIWRYNINLTVSRKTSSQFGDNKPQYYVRLYNKAHAGAVIGIINYSTMLYLKEIAASLAVRHIMQSKSPCNPQSDAEIKYMTPVSFYMQQGCTLAEMLFTEISSFELCSLSNIMQKNIERHPENKTMVKTIDDIAIVVESQKADVVKDITTKYIDHTKTARLYTGIWERIPISETQSYGKMDIYYHENGERPFSIRVANCLKQDPPFPVYPFSSETVQTYLITLSAEEFIGAFLIPLISACQ